MTPDQVNTLIQGVTAFTIVATVFVGGGAKATALVIAWNSSWHNLAAKRRRVLWKRHSTYEWIDADDPEKKLGDF